MERKVFNTSGVCAKQLSFDYEDNKVYNIEFVGGCNGNLKAIATLCEGQDMEVLINKLSGNTCGFKTTSCADQLAKAMMEVK